MPSSEQFAGQLAAMPPDAEMRIASLVDWAMTQVDSAIDAVGVEEVIRVALDLYKTHIVPLDIPLVPNILEPAVDEAIKLMIAKLIRGFHQLVHREQR